VLSTLFKAARGCREKGDSVLEVKSYVPADSFFGAPYIDVDEERTGAIPFRYVHGGFEGTDTRFAFSFPSEDNYQGRLFHPLEGAHAGHEDAFGGPMGDIIGGLGLIARLGGYMVESNSGHIGDDVDPRGGDDPTIYGHRASIESARFSKHVAAQVYGEPPHHAYVWGGSGGGRRSPMCLEYSNGVYDGALPFMGGGNIEPHGTTSLVRSAQPISFGSMFNVQRVLGDKVSDVVDAMAPGGSGDPFAGLSTHQREELDALYRLGYPRGDEYMIANPMGQMWLWCSMADMLIEEEDPDYFPAFWTKPGYVGHDEPWHVEADLIDTHTTIERVITASDLASDPLFEAPEFEQARPMALLMASMGGEMDLPIAIKVAGLDKGYLLGAGVRITSGKAAGRSLYVMNHGGSVLFCDGRKEANILRFADVEAGDSVHVSNRAFLAFCYYYRHHVPSDEERFGFLTLDGNPRYPQHGVPQQSPLMGVPYSGQYEGKLMWVHHTHDSSLWPPEGVVYGEAVRRAQGEAAAADKFRVRWTENAEHVPPFILSSPPNRATNTWLIDYLPVIEQSLLDLTRWVEDGVEPTGTAFEWNVREGRVTLPSSAAERGGIQPVVHLSVDGAERADVGVGATVAFEVRAEVPPGAGSIVSIAWDFDGSGSFPSVVEDIDGSQTSVTATASHTYDSPGTYFATALVHSHREGDVSATSRKVPNLAQVRVVVSA
jgi:hypothetical protein